jgi:hypothetical protein
MRGRGHAVTSDDRRAARKLKVAAHDGSCGEVALFDTARDQGETR